MHTNYEQKQFNITGVIKKNPKKYHFFGQSNPVLRYPTSFKVTIFALFATDNALFLPIFSALRFEKTDYFLFPKLEMRKKSSYLGFTRSICNVTMFLENSRQM